MPTDIHSIDQRPPDEQPATGAPPATLRVAPETRIPAPPPGRRFGLSVFGPVPRTESGPRWLRRFRLARDRFFDRIARRDGSRRSWSIVASLAINAVIFSVLAIYGRVEIFVPNRPADSISIVFVDLPVAPVIPDLTQPDVAPEPEPEPADPAEREKVELVEEPELTPDPEPQPIPEPEPETAPEPEPQVAPEPEPEPEPVIDFLPEPVFAPPSDVEDQPFVPERPAAEDDPTLRLSPDAPARDGADPDVREQPGQQTPDEEAPPLVEPERATPGPAGDNAAAGDGARRPGEDQPAEAPAEDEETEVGETRAGEEEAAPEAENPGAQFDVEPVFRGGRFVLPSVDLPAGAPATTPGTSGVVGIFCPEEFSDADKAAECAGRTEIRSGWRPGTSGERWDEAIRLLKKDKAGGDFDGQGGAAVFGPEIARRLEQRRREEALEDFRRADPTISDPDFEGSLAPAGGRPDLVPAPPEPTWSRPNDPDLTQKDLDRLKRELEEAERAKQSPQ